MLGNYYWTIVIVFIYNKIFNKKITQCSSCLFLSDFFKWCTVINVFLVDGKARMRTRTPNLSTRKLKLSPFHDLHPYPTPPPFSPKKLRFLSCRSPRYMMSVSKIFLANLFGEIIAKLSINYVDIMNTMHSGLCNSAIQ